METSYVERSPLSIERVRMQAGRGPLMEYKLDARWSLARKYKAISADGWKSTIVEVFLHVREIINVPMTQTFDVDPPHRPLHPPS